MTSRGSVVGLWIQALAVGFAMALAPAVTALCLVLLLPGITAWYVDASHGRPMGRAVLAFGIAGTFAPVWHHVQQDQTAQGVLDTATQSPAVAVAWGLAGTGWLVGRAAQFAVEVHLQSRTNERIRHLKAQHQALVTEWDLGR